MYFTQLPDHSRQDFDENLHFSRFKRQNIVFNAVSTQARCDSHIGCLSFKTVLEGEEWYGINGRNIALRPGQFLVLNDDQPYSCRIQPGSRTRILSIFFKREFAGDVFKDATHTETVSLDDPFAIHSGPIEFFQTLLPIDPKLNHTLTALLNHLENHLYHPDATDEFLVFLLRRLIRTHHGQLTLAASVNALKPSTKQEIFRRLCIVKDILHSSYPSPLQLQSLAKTACLSIPQLVRQFHTVYHATPHRYLKMLRLQHAARLLATTDLPILDITWKCGFEDPSAFCRSFKSAYGATPQTYRKQQQNFMQFPDWTHL
jgi:AraC-like DNA-binding protein